jgi:hypothetical protein
MASISAESAPLAKKRKREGDTAAENEPSTLKYIEVVFNVTCSQGEGLYECRSQVRAGSKVRDIFHSGNTLLTQICQELYAAVLNEKYKSFCDREFINTETELEERKELNQSTVDFDRFIIKSLDGRMILNGLDYILLQNEQSFHARYLLPGYLF